MYTLHLDLLYLRVRTNFHTDVVLANKNGDVLGIARPLYLSASKHHTGYYSFDATMLNRKYATSIPFQTDTEKTLLISQISPDSGSLHFLCEVDISYNLICFKRGTFQSTNFHRNSCGCMVLAHKTVQKPEVFGLRREFVNVPSGLHELQKHVRMSELRMFENPEHIFDAWHLQFYKSVFDLVKHSFGTQELVRPDTE